jgi:long-chain fatty acid transport protein
MQGVTLRNMEVAMDKKMCMLHSAWLVGGALAVNAVETFGAGFAVPLLSASAMGNADAGVAAMAEDASTAWWNPAGMAFLEKREFAGVLLVDNPAARFHNSASQAALGQSLGTDGGNAGRQAFVPALYATVPLSADWAAGVAFNVPFGLKTQYDDGWMGRYQAVKSQIKTYNLSSAISAKFDNLAIGGGVDVQRFDAELTNAVNYTAAIIQGGVNAGLLSPQQIAALLNPSNPANVIGLDGRAQLTGSDTRVGWNLGALYGAGPWKVGAHFRSRIKYHVHGDVKFDAPDTANPLAAQIIAAASHPGGALANGDVSVDIGVPDTATFGAVCQLSPDWELLAGAAWTGWSSVRRIEFIRSDGTLLNGIDYNWRDTWRLSAGFNYRYSDAWLIRAGVAWDQSVIRDDTFRDPRLPDSDLYWGSLGARYKPPSEHTWLDLAFAYIKPKDARLAKHSNGDTAAFGLLDGSYTIRSLLLSGQLTWEF